MKGNAKCRTNYLPQNFKNMKRFTPIQDSFSLDKAFFLWTIFIVSSMVWNVDIIKSIKVEKEYELNRGTRVSLVRKAIF